MRAGDETAVLAACEALFGQDGRGFLEAFPDMAAADEEFMEQPAGVTFMATFAESLRQGMVGYAQDLAVEAQPWTFDPEAIRVPVRVLHGDADTLVPLAHPHHTSDSIPTAELDVRRGHGHVSLLIEIPQFAAELITPLTARS
jgi:pimeloyl-ACP methyl ester carboxylesterase